MTTLIFKSVTTYNLTWNKKILPSNCIAAEKTAPQPSPDGGFGLAGDVTGGFGPGPGCGCTGLFGGCGAGGFPRRKIK